jgi:hypothetical protein
MPPSVEALRTIQAACRETRGQSWTVAAVVDGVIVMLMMSVVGLWLITRSCGFGDRAAQGGAGTPAARR